MATTAAAGTLAPAVKRLPKARYDHVFFPAVSWLMLITVFIGFAPTYYLAGMVRAPLPSTIIHVHAVVFSSWILLLIVQTSLVAGRRVDLHRKLGLLGFLLALLMIIVGILAAVDMLVRGGPVGRDPKWFFAITIANVLAFALLIPFAYRSRRDPAAHKRIIIVATAALLTAAISRWPFAMVHRQTLTAMLFSYAFVVLLVAYDAFTLHKIHRATWMASICMIAVQQVAFPLGRTAMWHSFAAWVQSLAR